MYRKEDFTVKKLTIFRGHEQEPLAQGDIYYKGKKVCFYSDGDWGGSAIIKWFADAPFSEKEFADWVDEQNFTYSIPGYPEIKMRYDGFLGGIMDKALELQGYKDRARNGTVFKLAEDGDTEFRYITRLKYPRSRAFLLNKYGTDVKVFTAGKWKSIE